jgi:CRP-like cAMP-binding protein
MHNQLIQHIAQKVLLTQKDIDRCKDYFKPVKFGKNALVEKQDDMPNNLYFINAGYMRLFYHHENGEEVTTYIGVATHFIASFFSFINGTKAKETIASITECETLCISREDLRTFIQQSENFRNFSTTIFEKAMVSHETRANDLATLSAEQRYRKLLESQPSIIQQVPIQYIASYLGIKPESLSRIRKQIIS